MRPAAATVGMPHRYFDALTGLRGLAAVAVFLFHWADAQDDHVVPIRAFHYGYLGVDVFFMLSGFVMAHAKYDQFAPTRPHAYLRFLRERLIRLAPVNTVVLLLVLVATLLWPGIVRDQADGRFSAAAFVASLVMVQAWVPAWIGWNTPGWSISAEWLAYLFLPAVLLLAKSLSSRPAVLAAAGSSLGLLAIHLLANGRVSPDGFAGPAVASRVGCEFMAGALLYQYLRLGPLAGARVLLIAAPVLLVAAFLRVESGSLLLCLPAFAALILLAAHGDNPVAAALTRGPVQFLGRVSFSFYMVHWPIIFLWLHWSRGAAPAVSLVAVFALTTGVAWACYRVLEQPAQRWSRRVGHAGQGGISPAIGDKVLP